MQKGTVGVDLAKQAFSLIPSGVVIVTTRDGRALPHGFTASSFTPLSLDPLMVLVCVARTARCHDAFQAAGSIGISVLGGDHVDVARRFASREDDKFGGLAFIDGPSGSPLLDGAVMHFEGRLADCLPGGDHAILTIAIDHLAGRGAPDVMTYFARGFDALPIPESHSPFGRI